LSPPGRHAKLDAAVLFLATRRSLFVVTDYALTDAPTATEIGGLHGPPKLDEVESSTARAFSTCSRSRVLLGIYHYTFLASKRIARASVFFDRYGDLSAATQIGANTGQAARAEHGTHRALCLGPHVRLPGRPGHGDRARIHAAKPVSMSYKRS
jgi:hypothetical protein